jgi:uncharacterized membrane protein YeaQ/YmgE (transglycosylase-associated protein family)
LPPSFHADLSITAAWEGRTVIAAIIWFLVVCLIAFAVARPDRDPMGIVGTILLGIVLLVGSFVGGTLASLLFTSAFGLPAGWFGSIIGAVIALLIWRWVRTRAA